MAVFIFIIWAKHYRLNICMHSYSTLNGSFEQTDQNIEPSHSSNNCIIDESKKNINYSILYYILFFWKVMN